MHLPDGIISSAPLLAGAALISAGAVSASLSRVARDRHPGQLAWTGTLAAFTLALQAINLPAAPGASAHALGASLLTLLLGPAAAVVALSTVVILQAVLLADGGIAALGINIINIVLIPVGAVSLMRMLRGAKRVRTTAILGTLLGNVVAAACLSTLLVFSAGAPMGWTFATLVGIQALAGLVEGVLTSSAVVHLQKRAPRLLASAANEPRGTRSRPMWAWAVVGLGVLLVALPIASSAPDALEVVLARAHATP